jgi:DNA repair photolyase
MAKRFGKIKDYQDWCSPKIVSNAEELLIKELPKFKEKIKVLHLCFTTDPFMYQNQEIIALSLRLLNIIAQNKIRASVLTKGVFPKEVASLPRDYSFGITLISLDESFREKMEPGSAPYVERIKSLKHLKELGFNTWVSIEPYPTPNILTQNLNSILEAVSFTDKIIFGRLNYNKLVSDYSEHRHFFNEAADTVIKFCDARKIEYHIKDGTKTE